MSSVKVELERAHGEALAEVYGKVGSELGASRPRFDTRAVARQVIDVAACKIRTLLVGRDLSELNFIMKSWKLENRPHWRGRGRYYQSGMTKVIGHLGLTQKLYVMVAPEEQNNELMGFICYRPLLEGDPAIVVHYVYVKPKFRRQGVARALLAYAGWTPALHIMGSHVANLPNAIQNRYKIEFNDFFVKVGNI